MRKTPFLTLLLAGTAVILLGILILQATPSPSGKFESRASASFFDWLFRRASPTTTPVVSPPPSPPPSLYRPSIDYEEAVIKAVENTSPAVISIIVSKDLPIIERCPSDPLGDLPPEFRQFFGGPFEFYQPCERGTKKQEVGGGSGFIVSPDGLVLTNKHVVADLKAEYTVLTNDGQKYSATILARDPLQDLAIVKILAQNKVFKTVTLGDSDTIKLGQTAIAIGNALGEFRNTVSVGIVSGLAREINAQGGGAVEHLQGLIQTDAAINPGNSGGPLLNLRGEVIGINTAVAAGAENIGFAIPINRARKDVESVKKYNEIRVPYLGVRSINITPEMAERDKLTVKSGALLRGGNEGPAVESGSPAAKAGLLAEDIIRAVNGETVTPERPLAALIQKYNVGDVVRLTVLRGEKPITLTVTLEQRKF